MVSWLSVVGSAINIIGLTDVCPALYRATWPGVQRDKVPQEIQVADGPIHIHIHEGDALDWLEWLYVQTDALRCSCQYHALVRSLLPTTGWPVNRTVAAGVCDDLSATLALEEAVRE